MIELLETSVKKFEELSNRELYEIIRLREEVFVVEQDCPYQDSDNKDLVSYHLQLRKDGLLVGYLRIIPRGISYEEASVGRVVVKKEERQHKYGERLLAEAISYLENEMNETQIRISAQHYLVNFYTKLGFVTVGDIYLEDFIDHIQMYYDKNGSSEPEYKEKLEFSL